MDVVAAFSALVVVLLIPGFGMLAVLVPRLPVGVVLVAAPAASLGLLLTWARLANLIGLPATPITTLVPMLLVGAALTVIAARRDGRKWVAKARAGWLTWTLLGGALLAGGLVWALAVPFADVPPNFDAMNHGFFAGRIAHTGDVSGSSALVSDIPTETSVYSYYPLAIHATVALLSRISGLPIDLLFNCVPLVFAALWLPLGTGLLARRLFPTVSLVAPAAALASSLIVVFPYKPLAWGGLTLIAGMALLPGMVLLALAVARLPRLTAASTFALAVAAVGLFELHNPEAVAVALIAGAIVLAEGLHAQSWREPLRWAIRWLLIGAGAVILMAPALGSIADEMASRRSFDDTVVEPFGATLGAILTLGYAVQTPQIAIMALVSLGAGIALWHRQAVGFLVAGIGFLGLAMAAATFDDGLLHALTLPWYRQTERIVYNLAIFGAVLAGVAIAVLLRGLYLLGSRARMPVPLVAVGSLLLLIVVAAPQWRTASALIADSYSHFAPVAPSDRLAWEFLADRVEPDERVLRQSSDGSQWMYALDGVNATPGVYVGALGDDIPVLADIAWLVDNLGRIDVDPQVRQTMEDLDIRFVYLDATHIGDSESQWDRQSLERTLSLDVAFEDRGSVVLRLI